MTRTLAQAGPAELSNLAGLIRDLTLERLETERLARVTVDFDGSVLSTKGRAEGTAVGFNPKRKGARSDYPLFCVLSQVGMFRTLEASPNQIDALEHRLRRAGESGLNPAGR